MPFKVIRETLRIKDSNSATSYRDEPLDIRFTHRGPVVSEALPELRTDKVITLRWAAAETMGPKIGFEELLTARSSQGPARGHTVLELHCPELRVRRRGWQHRMAGVG